MDPTTTTKTTNEDKLLQQALQESQREDELLEQAIRESQQESQKELEACREKAGTLCSILGPSTPAVDRAVLEFALSECRRDHDKVTSCWIEQDNGSRLESLLDLNGIVLSAALALMQFARRAEQRQKDAESIRLRNEIRSSGGIHSLLALS